MIASKSQIIHNAGRQGRTTLTEIESKQHMAEAGLHVVVDAGIGLANAR
jgi:hypothetical protein